MTLRDTIYRTVRGSNIAIAGLSLLAIAAGLIGFFGAPSFIRVPPNLLSVIGTSRMLLSHLGQPQVLTSSEVAQLSPGQLPLYNVQIIADRVDNLDGKSYDYVYAGDSDYDQIYHAILTVQGGDVLYRALDLANEQQTSYTGTLRIPWESTSVQTYARFNATYANDQNGHLYPFILDAGDNIRQWLLPAAVEALLFLAGLIGLGVVAWRWDISKHPIIKSVARYGDVDDVLREIDMEIATEKTYQVGKLQFTPNWLLYKAGYKMRIIRLEDVMWFYAENKSSQYGPNYMIYLFERGGYKLTVYAYRDGKSADAMFQGLEDHIPWAFAGYSKDVEKSWKNDKEGFALMIDVRRMQINTPDAS